MNLEIELENIIKPGKSDKEYIESYLKIIENAKPRGIIKPKDGYFELHHIVPRSKGGNDYEENLVLLTMPEHIVCHILLYMAYPGDQSLVRAANMMIGITRGGTSLLSLIKNNELYVKLRDEILSASSHSWEIKVVCFDRVSNDVIRIYNSITEASRLDGFSISKISAVLSGTRKLTGGYRWDKLENYRINYPLKLDVYYKNLDSGIIPDIIHMSTKVVCCSLDGNIEAIYKNIIDAERLDGYDSRQISAVLVGKQKTSREHLWYRYDNYPNKDELITFEKNNPDGSKSIPIMVDYTIVKFTPDLSFVRLYKSLTSAADDIGIDRRCLSLSTSGKLKEYSGYYFMKLKEFRDLYGDEKLESAE